MTARPASTLSALRYGEFRLLFSGLVAANLGLWMQEFALGWLVVQLAVRDGNPALAGFYLGLRSLAGAVPALAFGLFAGVYADRTDRRQLLILTRVASAIVAAVLAVLVITDHVNIGIVMLLSAASSAAFAFDMPGRHAILPSVVPARELFSAVGLMRASMQAAHAVGPLIAGLLIVPIGIGGVLFAKAALVAASIGAMLPMKPRPAHAGARDLGVLASLREGLSHMRRDDLIRWCVILQIAFAFLAQAFMQLLPAVAVETLSVGVTELSWLVAAVGSGALAGAFLIASVARVERRGGLMLGTMLAIGAALVLFGLQREVAGAVVVLVAIGVLQQVFFGTLTVTMQLAAPDRLRGRVMGIQSVVFMGCGPLGVLAIGTLGTFIGVSNAILIGGLGVLLVATVVALRVPVIRGLRGHVVPAVRLEAAAFATPAAADGAE
ncbi:MAG: MFS transporter [Chloroflexota bacterium]|nr:MFS transporter [Chloroflexota bacterium]